MLHECDLNNIYNNDLSNDCSATITVVNNSNWNLVITGPKDGNVFIPISYCPFCGEKLQ